jgi:N utilization substance protein B
MRKQDVEESIEAFYKSLYSAEDEESGQTPPEPRQDRFMEELARGAASRIAELDRHITAHSEHWRVERMPAVDRSILRLAVFELMSGAVPAAVVIDEAIELARRFSGDDSLKFINGVLDAVRKDLEKPAST